MPIAFRYRSGAGLVLLAALFVFGCGGGTVDTGPSSDPTATAPPGMSGSDRQTSGSGDAPRTQVVPPPGAVMPEGRLFNVTIYTSGAIVYADNLELEFNRRRGLHSFYGFYEDDFRKMVQIPWEEIWRVDFGTNISESLWEQVLNNREQSNLRRDEIFGTQITYHDRRVQLFYAVIPKFRGWRNQQIWELSMRGNPAGFLFMEFDR